MDKKGSEHIDWMISMGLFLLGVITIFLLLKPGIQKEHNEDFLLELLEEKFKEDFFWTVKNVPLSIGLCESYVDESKDPPAEVKPKIDLHSGPGWSLTQTHLFSKQESTGIVIDRGANKNPIWNGITCDNDIPSGFCNDKYECHIIKDSSDSDFIYYLTYATENPVEFNIEDTTENCVIDHCDYRIGAVEDFYGLNDDGFNFKDFFDESKKTSDVGLSLYRRSKIKETWDFPENKEFFIKSENKDILEFNYETTKPEERTSVYAKTFKTSIVNKYGEIIPITIYFGVW